MEQLQPQIHEQAAGAEGNESVLSPGPKLSELAQKNLRANLEELKKQIETAIREDGPAPESAVKALGELDDLCTGLLGLTLPELKNRELEEQRAELMKFDEEAAGILAELIDAGCSKSHILRGLAGMDSPKSWEIRNNILNEAILSQQNSLLRDDIADGLAGLDSDEAWQMREKLREHIPDKSDVDITALITGVTGIDSPRAWQLRQEGVNGFLQPILHSLVGVDSPQAWEMREQYLNDEETRLAVAISLGGMDTPQSWEIREKFDKQLPDNGYGQLLGSSIVGLDSEKAWGAREYLIGLPDLSNVLSALERSLAGLDSGQAWEMREWLTSLGRASHGMETLAGVWSPKAWETRRGFLEQFRYRMTVDDYIVKTISASLSGDDPSLAAAWRYAKGLLPHQPGK